MHARQANARQAHGWETDSQAVRHGSATRMHGWRKFPHGRSQTDARMKKIFARIQSNECTDEGNFCTDAVKRIHGWWILNGWGRTNERLKKIPEQAPLQLWTTRSFWLIRKSALKFIIGRIKRINLSCRGETTEKSTSVRVSCCFVLKQQHKFCHATQSTCKWRLKMTVLSLWYCVFVMKVPYTKRFPRFFNYCAKRKVISYWYRH